MNDTLSEFGQYIHGMVPDRVTSYFVANGELTLMTTAMHILELALFLRDDEHCKFSQLMDVTAIDYPNRAYRFEVTYNLLSLKKNLRIRLKVPVEDGVAVTSICEAFPSANWFEREVWDMYGIFFMFHPDMRRILTDYGFEGHPQRKDFPLTGYVELRYDEDQKRVVYEKVKLNQAYRSFDFLSPWEGTTYLDKAPPPPPPPPAPPAAEKKAS